MTKVYWIRIQGFPTMAPHSLSLPGPCLMILQPAITSASTQPVHVGDPHCAVVCLALVAWLQWLPPLEMHIPTLPFQLKQCGLFFFFFLLSHLENKWEEYLRALTCGPLKAGMSQPTEDAQYAGLSDSLLGRWAKEGADLLLTECNRECPLASLVLTLRSISFCEEFFCRPFIQPDQGLWKIT